MRRPPLDPASRRPRGLGGHPWLRWTALGLLAVVALVLVVVAIGLQPFVRRKTREALDGLDGASGDFLDARATLLPPRYTVTHLKIRKRDALLPDPFLYAERVSVELDASSLLGSHRRARVQAEGVKVVIEQPKPGPPSRLPELAKVAPFPAVVDRLELRRGEVLYAWVREPGRPTLWFHGIEATLENLATRPGLTRAPLRLAARGTVQRRGTMWANVTADEFASPIETTIRAGIEGFDLAQMNAYVGTQQGVKVTPGSFDVTIALDVRKGRLTGLVDPTLTGSELTAANPGLGSALKTLLGKVSLTLSGPADGTRPSGAIAVHDDLTDPSLQLPAVVQKSVENALVLGMTEALKRRYAGPPEKRAADAKPTPTPLEAGRH